MEKRKYLVLKTPDHVLNRLPPNMDLTSIFCAIDNYCTKRKINSNLKILSNCLRKRNRKFE
ncbi:hypothetical protein LEP1GSC125_3849 [Leptospira mayottensis 200901122]|uniref:Uncharacterized protein n=1 Tax=Leptospira mayottensis 200901122 TaxID=1193010 RepID=A0AA87SYA6_9LEPT|nr:hypothetical protein LEP1GSC125_3849 [Leptospira mayottensis 200901122]